MSSKMSLLPQLIYFSLTLAALIWLGRWITHQVQVIGLHLTGSERVALLFYYLLLLPGIILHELSHAAVAVLLGLKVSEFSLGPRVRGRYVELGSVRVTSGGTLRDSLVGLAPFVVGTAVLLLVGYQIFDVAALGAAWQNAGWSGVTGAIAAIWPVRDFWLWAYVLFVASNAMIPSPADRQPWVTAAMYLGLALVLTYLLGGLSTLASALIPEVAGALQFMTLAFVFTLVLDVIAAAALYLIEAVIDQFQRRA
jgi:hypothetical protein